MFEKEINELGERVNRIIGLMNQIKAEMDGNILSVSVSNLSRDSDIHISGEYNPKNHGWDYDFFKSMFPDYKKAGWDEVNNKLFITIDGVDIFTLEDKE